MYLFVYYLILHQRDVSSARAETLVSRFLPDAQGLQGRLSRHLFSEQMGLAGRRFQWDSLLGGSFTKYRLCPQGLCQEGKETPVEAGRGWNSGAHVSWHLISF